MRTSEAQKFQFISYFYLKHNGPGHGLTARPHPRILNHKLNGSLLFYAVDQGLLRAYAQRPGILNKMYTLGFYSHNPPPLYRKVGSPTISRTSRIVCFAVARIAAEES